jgi:hypothetical protein
MAHSAVSFVLGIIAPLTLTGRGTVHDPMKGVNQASYRLSSHLSSHRRW